MFNFASVVQLVLSFKGVNKTIILDRKKEVSRRKQEETLTPACLDFVDLSRAGWESQAVGLVSFEFFLNPTTRVCNTGNQQTLCAVA